MQITKNLKLLKFKSDEENQELKSNNLHHIWIIDRSGSMCNIIKDFISDLKTQVRKLQPGDALSFGWFSGEGVFGFPIKVYKITDDVKCFEELDKLFDNNSTTLGLTNFSCVLNEAGNLIKESSFLNMKTSLLFFSDGYPNDPSIEKEYKQIRDVLNKLSREIDSFITIAHSNYSDHDFLLEMAEICGGESVGSSNLLQVSKLLSKWLRGSSKLQSRRYVDVSSLKSENVLSVFSFNEEGSLNLYKIPDDNLVGTSNDLFALVSNSGDVDNNIDNKFYYATALVLAKKGKISLALEVLNEIGEKYFIDKLSNVFTPSERAIIEDELSDAIVGNEYRFKYGKELNYLPKEDVFCLLDFIDVMVGDESSIFYPKHKLFEYNTIGRKIEIDNKYPEFNTYVNNKCKFSDIIFNQDFLNASVLTKLKGTVNIPDEFSIDNESMVKPISLPSIIESYQYKTFTLIKDGYLNIKLLPISASEETIDILTKNNIISNKLKDDIYIVDLSKLPIVNRKIGNLKISAKELMADFATENDLKASIKVLNFLRNEINPEAPKIENQFNEEENAFLKFLGFREDGSYSPPFKTLPPTDVNNVIKFKLSIKGLSSLPSIKDTRERMTAIKNAIKDGTKIPTLTSGMKLIAFHLENIEFALSKFNNDNEKIKLIDETLTGIKSQLRKTRKRIQESKFSLVLGGNWFDDLEAKSENSIEIDLWNGEKATGFITIKREEVNV